MTCSRWPEPTRSLWLQSRPYQVWLRAKFSPGLNGKTVNGQAALASGELPPPPPLPWQIGSEPLFCPREVLHQKLL